MHPHRTGLPSPATPPQSVLAFAFVVAAACAAAACDKKPDTPPEAPPAASASASSAPSTAPSASSAPSATPDATPAGDAASQSASDAATAAAAPSTAATGKTPTPAPTASGPKTYTCGTKPLPDCPLQAWMKAHANPPMAAGDTPGLGDVFDQMVNLGPPGYTNWASISRDGAKAAKLGKLDGAKAACRSCHDQYKAKYRLAFRDRKI
ncbi:MAG: hypothetical protein IPF92_14895 [Myxococcales bacterium]|nr:hypothetical protein [Myxococcales bacterium]MBL0195163.1 hypothetical protein [Myxococcales bacterium]HQY62547.1 hypothetical protein [Polyangiaceae bacterium]